MGLPRLPEPFHRVYSPPEAPKVKARRSGVAGVVFAVCAAVALVAVGIFAFGRGGARPRSASTAAHPPLQPRTTAPQESAQPLTFATIPNACAVLPASAVRRFVPTDSPHVDKMGAETASVCKYSLSEGRRYRAVQVDARAFLPKYMHGQATGMTVWSYEAQWKQAVKDLTPDTHSLRRIGGLGDAAFERYWIDRDVHVAVGEATVRYRNVVLRMQYTEEQPSASGRAASERRCLSSAIAAARAGLPAFH
ncbi:hypothetical protein [Actinomadura sp. DC4]|uniref:hypothetical protein n=1 Tax=Actinomadura sp. DC4 TaxID=3055069 RepID=UPI0025B196FE|nr:hypothetical protein [Actinomadura sp. DC4]MDN3351637.1 hypothetical protein [Actinomadura sp. DC4]